METPGFLKRLFGMRDPRRAANLVAEGVVAARAGDLPAALACYQKALSADDTYPLAHLNVALALQDLYNADREGLTEADSTGRFALMADHLRRALELDPRLTPGLRALGHVERALGNYVEARDAFARYLEAADAQDPHRERVEQMLVEVTDKALLLEHARVGLAVAEHAADSDENARADALQRLAAVMEREPARAELHWAVGVLKRAGKDLPGAVASLQKALEVDPACVPAHKELAGLYFHGNNAAAALPHARASFDADPTNAAVVCNLGVCHLALGQLEQAAEFVFLARDLSPKDPIIVDAVRAVEEAQKAAGR
ncbi:MAG: tetratricopeptide repeat protein [Deltaproteobacteria bacterium]|nr:tetratricopeptide repeat protein [Deltaproteobacteria bacterium]